MLRSQLLDSLSTYILDKNPTHRAAVETLVTTNMVTLAGEYKSSKELDREVIADIVRRIGLAPSARRRAFPVPRSGLRSALRHLRGARPRDGAGAHG